MRASLLHDTLIAFHAIRRPAYIIGPPGCGKTQVVKQVAESLGRLSGRPHGHIQVHVPLMQPEDHGMPVISLDRESIKFVVPDKFPTVGNDTVPEDGTLVLDEMGQGDNSIQKIMANLIQERELHGQKLKPGWSIIATGNRATDRAGSNRILSHLNNRWTQFEFDMNIDDWRNWALGHAIHPMVIAYLNFKPTSLDDFKPDRDINPTARSWAEGVSPVLGNVPDAAEYDAVRGAVGEGHATEFMAFMKIARKLPNIDTILANPSTHAVPDEPSVLYALSGALAHRATVENFDTVMDFSRRLPPEFCVLVVRDAMKRDPNLGNTKAWINWVATQGADILR